MFSAKSQNRSFKYLNINKTHKKSLIFAAFLLSVISFSTLNEAYTEDAYTKGQATGANEIFDLIGQEKPSNWSQLDKKTKHDYLQSLGAYPISSGKYKGRVDLDRYFETLGVAQPNNWLSLSTKQRQEFISNLSLAAQEPTTNPQAKPSKENAQVVQSVNNTETSKIPGSGQGSGSGRGNGARTGSGAGSGNNLTNDNQKPSIVLVEPTFEQRVDGQLILMLFFLSVGISTGFYGFWATAKGKW